MTFVIFCLTPTPAPPYFWVIWQIKFCLNIVPKINFGGRNLTQSSLFDPEIPFSEVKIMTKLFLILKYEICPSLTPTPPKKMTNVIFSPFPSLAVICKIKTWITMWNDWTTKIEFSVQNGTFGSNVGDWEFFNEWWL